MGGFKLYKGCAVMDLTVGVGLSWWSVALLMFIFTIISSLVSSKCNGVWLMQCSVVITCHCVMSTPLQ